MASTELILIFKQYIWLPLCLVLLWAFWQSWIFYVQNKYLASRDWVLLRIKVPEQIKITPKSMEQAIAGFHGIYKKPNLIEKYIDGMLPRFMSLEIAGIAGEVYFFVRTEKQFRELVESNIYAQYPDAEINEAEDYSKTVPKIIPSKDWNLWGAEMILTNEKYYPIRTYPSFKEEEAEEGMIDPLSSLAEIMSRLKQGEQIWVQILISPTHEDWDKKGQAFVHKLIGKHVPKSKGFLDKSVVAKETAGWSNAVSSALFGTELFGAGAQEEQKPEWPSMMQHLSPGEKTAVEAIETKCAKIGFDSKIRFIYLGKRDVFAMSNVSAFMGAFKQFNIQNLNGFKADPKTKSSIDYLFKKRRSVFRRRTILTKYRWRSMSGQKMILNIEEIASIYHFPTSYVKAPHMPRIEAKKSSPPSGLPVG